MQAIGTIVTAIALLVVLSLIMALPTMWLWDWLMPELFGLKTITLFQAWGVNFLCGMLFKSHNNSSK